MKNPETIDLEACLLQVEASRAWFGSRVLPLSIEQLRWRLDHHQWSIAECLDHLNLTLAIYLPKIDAAISSGSQQGLMTGESPAYEPAEIEYLALIEPPVTAKIDAPHVLRPAPAIDPDLLVDDFHRVRDHYARAVRRARHLDLARIQIVDPVCSSIRSLGGALALMAVHERRHMWQAERVRQSPRFPQALFAARR